MKRRILDGVKAVGWLCLLLGLSGLLTGARLRPIAALGSDLGNGDALPAGFNGDGYADLAVGVPFEDLINSDVGAVNVLYGSGNGLSAAGNQIWHQDIPGIPDTLDTRDEFGTTLATGDLNGDGYADLAIGIPGEDSDVGMVQVLYGMGSGLSTAGNQIWHQGSPGINGEPEAGDEFGRALATGDFDGDGYADLAVGVPFEDLINGYVGAVNVLYGSDSGLSAARNQIWHQDIPGIPDTLDSGDQFGAALAAGDFDGDNYADLAVGVPGEDGTGIVQVLYGSGSGLSATENQVWHQGTSGIEGEPEAGDGFGAVLATGDLNGDGYTDLVVGVPAENVEGTDNAGAVNVLYGSRSGLSATGNQIWHQNSPGIAGVGGMDDMLGWALAVGDLNGDGYADLAAGVPFEDIEGTRTAGAVNVLYGSGNGLSAAGSQIWHQDSPNIEDSVEVFDQFGRALAAGDLNGDGYTDLAVGVPYEEIGGWTIGAVNVLYGSGNGLSATGNQIWHQGSPGIAGEPESGDSFGWSLAILPHDRASYRVYLPMIAKDALLAPDLVIHSMIATQNGVQVEIANVGNRPAGTEFWVDLYVNPDPAPTGVNQTWPMLGNKGIVWGIEELTAGETIVLTYGDAYMWPSRTTFDGVSAGDVLYVQVDSAKVGSDFGAVYESHEITGGTYNNITQYTVTSTSGATALPSTAILGRYDLGSWPQRP